MTGRDKGKPMSEVQAWLIILAVIGGILAVFALAGCDTPRAAPNAPQVSAPPAEVIRFPADFRDVARTCDGPNMVYSAAGWPGGGTAVAGSVAVIPNDPRCAK